MDQNLENLILYTVECNPEGSADFIYRYHQDATAAMENRGMANAILEILAECPDPQLSSVYRDLLAIHPDSDTIKELSKYTLPVGRGRIKVKSWIEDELSFKIKPINLICIGIGLIIIYKLFKS